MQNVPVALDTLVRYELGSHILHLLYLLLHHNYYNQIHF